MLSARLHLKLRKLKLLWADVELKILVCSLVVVPLLSVEVKELESENQKFKTCWAHTAAVATTELSWWLPQILLWLLVVCSGDEQIKCRTKHDNICYLNARVVSTITTKWFNWHQCETWRSFSFSRYYSPQQDYRYFAKLRTRCQRWYPSPLLQAYVHYWHWHNPLRIQRLSHSRLCRRAQRDHLLVGVMFVAVTLSTESANEVAWNWREKTEREN